mgnify:CR=1 FL=1|tara:strand:- start:721 stop:1026 length:306 start_codon:yes stop_codon:yes gene_type:complete
MKNTIYLNEFRRAFEECRPDNFSYNGIKALYDYFDELEQNCDIEIEFDCIAICCEYSEYENGTEAVQGYHQDECTEEEAIEYLQDHTQVIEFEDGIIIQDY